MGSDKTPKLVRVWIRHDAHIDEAYITAGYVSKRESLLVKKTVARDLVNAHQYLVMED